MRHRLSAATFGAIVIAGLLAAPGGVGFTDATYMSLPGIGDTGDRVIWYQRQQ